jgi:hypothetical protein
MFSQTLKIRQAIVKTINIMIGINSVGIEIPDTPHTPKTVVIDGNGVST